MPICDDCVGVIVKVLTSAVVKKSEASFSKNERKATKNCCALCSDVSALEKKRYNYILQCMYNIKLNMK